MQAATIPYPASASRSCAVRRRQPPRNHATRGRPACTALRRRDGTPPQLSPLRPHAAGPEAWPDGALSDMDPLEYAGCYEGATCWHLDAHADSAQPLQAGDSHGSAAAHAAAQARFCSDVLSRAEGELLEGMSDVEDVEAYVMGSAYECAACWQADLFHQESLEEEAVTTAPLEAAAAAASASDPAAVGPAPVGAEAAQEAADGSLLLVCEAGVQPAPAVALFDGSVLASVDGMTGLWWSSASGSDDLEGLGGGGPSDIIDGGAAQLRASEGYTSLMLQLQLLEAAAGVPRGAAA